MDTLAVLLRLAVALGSVVGLIWLVSRGMNRGRAGRVAGLTEVVARQPLSRAASVVVVRVGERTLVLGVTEQQVSLLTETELPEAVEATDPVRVTEVVDLPRAADASTGQVAVDALPRQRPRRAQQQGALAGSALSPATWTQALDVLRERTTRR